MAKGVLTVDVGNTTTKLGIFTEKGELAGTWELTTPARLTADEARAQLAQAFAMMGAGADGAGVAAAAAGGATPASTPDAAILACVVPSLTSAWRAALAAACACRPLVVGPGLKTGMRMRYDDPSEIGADRIADVVAARETYGAPAIVVDLGTTTNFEVVDAEGAFAGGVIAPGMGLGAAALAERAAKLPMVELRAPAGVVGKSTEAAMRSGLVLGEVARIEGLLAMIERELGAEGAVPVVLTGDDAQAMSALLARKVAVDNTLTLRGLHKLWRLNAGKK